MPALVTRPSLGSRTNCVLKRTTLAVDNTLAHALKGKSSLTDSLAAPAMYCSIRKTRTNIFTALPTDTLFADHVTTWRYKIVRPCGQARFSRSRARRNRPRTLRVKRTLVKQRSSLILLEKQATRVRHMLNTHSSRDQKPIRSILGIQNTRQTTVRTETLPDKQRKAVLAQAQTIRKVEEGVRAKSARASSVTATSSCFINAITRASSVALGMYNVGRINSAFSVREQGVSGSTFTGSGAHSGAKTHTSSYKSAKAAIASEKVPYILLKQAPKTNVVDTREGKVFKPFGTNLIFTSPNEISRNILAGKFNISNPMKVGSFLFTGLVGSFTAATGIKAAAANSYYSHKTSYEKDSLTPMAAIIGAQIKVRRNGRMTGTSAMPEEPRA